MCHCVGYHGNIIIEQCKLSFHLSFDRRVLGSGPPTSPMLYFLARLREEPVSDDGSTAEEGVLEKGGRRHSYGRDSLRFSGDSRRTKPSCVCGVGPSLIDVASNSSIWRSVANLRCSSVGSPRSCGSEDAPSDHVIAKACLLIMRTWSFFQQRLKTPSLEWVCSPAVFVSVLGRGCQGMPRFTCQIWRLTVQSDPLDYLGSHPEPDSLWRPNYASVSSHASTMKRLVLKLSGSQNKKQGEGFPTS